jgi:hypothetical protein
MSEVSERANIIEAALEAGFMISTAHGQDKDKLMPVSDVKTLREFYKLAKQKEGK